MSEGMQSILPIEPSVIYTDHQGKEKKGIKKRQNKLLGKCDFIRKYLQEDEKILLVTTACSPMSAFEQLFTGWIVYYLKRALLIVTNRGVYHIPTTVSYDYRNSIAFFAWGDCEYVKIKGKTLKVQYKTGRKEAFYYVNGKEKKKLKAIVNTTSLQSEPTVQKERTHLCPACGHPLVNGRFVCPHCNMQFKSKEKGVKISFTYPGGGYFYTGHYLMGVLDAIIESLLILVVLFSIFEFFQGETEALGSFFFYGLILMIEKLQTVYHTNMFLKEFIPASESPVLNQ